MQNILQTKQRIGGTSSVTKNSRTWNRAFTFETEGNLQTTPISLRTRAWG